MYFNILGIIMDFNILGFKMDLSILEIMRDFNILGFKRDLNIQGIIRGFNILGFMRDFNILVAKWNFNILKVEFNNLVNLNLELTKVGLLSTIMFELLFNCYNCKLTSISIPLLMAMEEKSMDWLNFNYCSNNLIFTVKEHSNMDLKVEHRYSNCYNCCKLSIMAIIINMKFVGINIFNIMNRSCSIVVDLLGMINKDFKVVIDNCIMKLQQYLFEVEPESKYHHLIDKK